MNLRPVYRLLRLKPIWLITIIDDCSSLLERLIQIQNIKCACVIVCLVIAV